MKAYLLWSLQQLYLLAFWPTQFVHEIEDAEPGQTQLRFRECLHYLGKMLPWIVVFAIIGNIITGQIYDMFWDAYKWGPSWFGVTLGVTGGVTGGVALGVA